MFFIHIPFRNPHYCNVRYDKWNDGLRNEDSNGTERSVVEWSRSEESE